jgi:hypothetical protein
MPAQRKNLLGQTFSWLTVTGRAGANENRQSMWTARCRCGREITLRSDQLTRGEKSACPECAVEFRLRAIFPERDREPRPRFTVSTIGRGTSETRFSKQ